jgi:hypothetical protein
VASDSPLAPPRHLMTERDRGARLAAIVADGGR